MSRLLLRRPGVSSVPDCVEFRAIAVGMADMSAHRGRTGAADRIRQIFLLPATVSECLQKSRRRASEWRDRTAAGALLSEKRAGRRYAAFALAGLENRESR